MARITRVSADSDGANIVPSIIPVRFSPTINESHSHPDPYANPLSNPFALSLSNTFSIRDSVSVIAERRRFRSQLGPYQYEGKRDIYTALGYPRQLLVEDYRDVYERGDVMARLVEFFPQSTWLPSVAVNEVDDPDIVTAFESQWTDFDRRLSIIADVFMRADILARIFRYSIIIIGAPGDLNTPLTLGHGSPDAIQYFTVLGEDRALITRMVGQSGVDENGRFPGDAGYIDPATSLRFGLPLTYRCKLGVATNYFSTDGPISAATGSLLERDVHWSRVWHIANGTLDNKVYGQSMYRRIMNRFIDYEKVAGATAEGKYRYASPKIHADMDPAMSIDPAEEALYKDQLDGLRHGFEDVIRTRGVKLNMLNGVVASMKDDVDTLLRSMAASHGIPARVLSGSEEARMAGAQDDNHTNDRQTEIWGYYATPQLTGFIKRLIDFNYMTKPKELTIVWPEIEEHTEMEKSTIAGIIALANSNQIKSGDTPLRSSVELRGELWGLRDPIELPEPPPPEPTVVQMVDKDGNPMDNPNPNPNPSANRSASTTVSLDPSNDPTRRVLIIGGPRRGKSTLARNLRTADDNVNGSIAIPTFCGDPISLVKDPEPGVTYLPENLSWSESSQYIADNWLTQPGPWCCEGIAMARAVRKLVNSDRSAVLDGVEIVVISDPIESAGQLSSGQIVMAKGVMTVWAEVADMFPQAKMIERKVDKEDKTVNAAGRSHAALATRPDDAYTVSMPAGRRATASKKNRLSSKRYSFRVW